MIRLLFATTLALGLAGCGPAATKSSTVPRFAAIGEAETVRVTGTEPFWAAQVAAGAARYSTPERPEGVSIPVTRFAGNSGLGFSGTLDGRRFDLMVTQGICSDGMSDRSYPFHATLMIGEEKREGCAWTDSHPFEGPANP